MRKSIRSINVKPDEQKDGERRFKLTKGYITTDTKETQMIVRTVFKDLYSIKLETYNEWIYTYVYIYVYMYMYITPIKLKSISDKQFK